MSDLERAVKAVIEDCLVVKEGEDVVVVCNPGDAEPRASDCAPGPRPSVPRPCSR